MRPMLLLPGFHEGCLPLVGGERLLDLVLVVEDREKLVAVRVGIHADQRVSCRAHHPALEIPTVVDLVLAELLVRNGLQVRRVEASLTVEGRQVNANLSTLRVSVEGSPTTTPFARKRSPEAFVIMSAKLNLKTRPLLTNDSVAHGMRTITTSDGFAGRGTFGTGEATRRLDHGKP